MEKAEVFKIYDDYKSRVNELTKVINPSKTKEEIDNLEKVMGEPDF